MATSGIHRSGLKGSYLSLLSDEEVEQVHRGALHILARTGLAVHDESLLVLLDDAGCRVDMEGRHAWIPARMVEEALALAPGVVTLYNRLGEEAMALGSGHLYARTSSGATGILDLDTGQRRAPTRRDAADVARLADALPHVHGVSAMAVQPADVPATIADVHAVRLALANTVKPLGCVFLNEGSIGPVLEMASTVVGGEAILQRRPTITALAESTSPLQLVESQLAVLKAFASRRLPLTLHAHPMAGFTAPVTLAGELVITHAEVLALATLAQVVQPGTPVVYGMSSSVPDMRTGLNLSGAVEIGMMGAAVAKLARHCGLPCVVSTGTDAHTPGAQSVMERLMTLLPPALAGADLVNLTTLDTKMSFSLEQLVMDDAVLGLVERCLQGIRVDSETLALDLIHQVGPGGAFVTEA
ncbi:MAG: trimethylamine methyltransferase family protein, partial [Anaerolineae bacterium]|nr:trimethylamine methyltransferase family protein [Anaerolineae bacterium]